MAMPSYADWTRLVVSPKGGLFDEPEAETLDYFTRYPSLHDNGGDFCYLCTESQRFEAAKKQNVKVDKKFLGRIRGRAIYSLLYYFDDDPDPSWETLLVQKQGDMHGEVLQIHPTYPSSITGGLKHPELIKVRNEQLIHSVSDCYRRYCREFYFRIGTDGPVSLLAPP